ncbi:Protein crumbs -like protein 1 Precursor [Channa argus]|uniref:Protein crumbs-like protein 1 n=1 Tax=Channa argus TaxID=215402 RepID=A0A6G1PKB8_CHAAH|nr:Protein crumbs -like protein 1 Precursor [Channa argus]
MLGLALAVAKLREKRQTEEGLGLRQLEAPGGHNPPAELENTSISTLAARVERLLTSEGLTSDLLLSISLVSVVLLLVLVLTSFGLVMTLNRRATHGTYSPSRQEKESSRVEMWSITQPPPMERLI